MKKNKLMWILIIAVVIVIAGIGTALCLLLSGGSDSKYYNQMEDAKVYLEAQDYESMVKAYETAIELRPEDPDAYLKLAEYYLEQGEYYEASYIANKGYENTNSRRLENMIATIELSRVNQETGDTDLQISTALEEQEDNPKLLIRNLAFGNFAEYCYQQYVNEYGDSSSSFVSNEEGYKITFKGLGAEVYFKEVDAITKKPIPNTMPYKVLVTNPQLLFVGFEGYISSSKVGELFNIQPSSVLAAVDDGYYLVFEYLNATIRIEADAKGNITKSKPTIEICPMKQISDWEPEEETAKADSGNKVSGANTFVLGSQSYSYSITELIIYDEVLEDLSPLADCPNLKYIVFEDCTIKDLSPLSGCSSLVELDLGGSTGSMNLSCLKDLSSLKYLGFHECRDISDISCIYGLSLYVLHPCGSSVSRDQCIEYQQKHPECEVWYDYYYPIP